MTNYFAIAFIAAVSISQANSQQLPRSITPLDAPIELRLQNGASSQCMTTLTQKTGAFGRGEDMVFPLDYSVVDNAESGKSLFVRFERSGKPQVRVNFGLSKASDGGLETKIIEIEQRKSKREKWEIAHLYQPTPDEEKDEARDYPLQAFLLIRLVHSFDYWKAFVDRRFSRGASVQLDVCGVDQQTNTQLGSFKLEGQSVVSGRESIVFSGRIGSTCVGGGLDQDVLVEGWFSVDKETGLPTASAIKLKSSSDQLFVSNIRSECTIFSP